MKRIVISERQPSLFELRREAGTGSKPTGAPVRVPRKVVAIRASRVVTLPVRDWKKAAASDASMTRHESFRTRFAVTFESGDCDLLHRGEDPAHFCNITLGSNLRERWHRWLIKSGVTIDCEGFQ